MPYCRFNSFSQKEGNALSFNRFLISFSVLSGHTPLVEDKVLEGESHHVEGVLLGVAPQVPETDTGVLLSAGQSGGG